MRKEIEICRLDLRYESYRMQSQAQENRLLSSIALRGIEEPLEGAELGDGYVLLNGFKRYRCAQKLGIGIVPYTALGEDEVMAIMALLRTANQKSLNILEQAAFVDELKNSRGMSVAEIAAELSVSKAWVSVRVGLLAEMTPKIRDKLFTGAFPVYGYMYTLRSFMRINRVGLGEIEALVVALSGKGLSLREIEQLAHGYFRGPESFRREIEAGNLALPLRWLAEAAQEADGCSEAERVFLKDLELLGKYMQRVMAKSQNARLKSRPFHAQCHLLTGGIMSRSPAFLQTLRGLHDRSREA